ncbi:RNA polymerase sigma factor [Streptomyces sp. NPDC050164]|uniref:RNA polymerase sigma factor n=1 Tax=Streptomyces sp. NPDC050164 TaxID=3365605 RepID=UPI00379FBAB7
MDSTVVSTAATAAACAAGCVARVLITRITARDLVRKACTEEEARTARVNALREGGTLQERDHTGRELAVRQGPVARGKSMDRMADAPAAVADARQLSLPAVDVSSSYQEDRSHLIRFLLRHGASFPEAEDAVHSAFVELMRTRRPVQSPRAWLRTVAVRAFLRQMVTEQPEHDLADRLAEASVNWHTPLHAVELGEQQRRVLQALIQLPFKQRSVMAWHLDGFSTAEIAEAMGLEKPEVLQNLSRACRTLKQQLGITGRRSPQ